jgi:hypothetical protein
VQHGVRKAAQTVQAVRLIQIAGQRYYSRCAHFRYAQGIAHQAEQAITRTQKPCDTHGYIATTYNQDSIHGVIIAG